jgi:hypothetical protein
MANLKRLDELAGIGRDFIGLQFRLTPDELMHSIDQLWVLGYCFGVLDAVRQKAQLGDAVEGLSLVAVGFFLLMSDEAKAADMMRQALNRQEDPRFAHGSLRGGEDMFAWFADTTQSPRGLSEHFGRSPSGH